MANIEAYLRKGRTGQVIIKFKGEEHLCKLYVEDGEVVYLSCGRKTPEEILDDLSLKEIEAVNFIDGIRPPKRLDSPVTQAVLERSKELPISAPLPEATSQETVEASKVDALIEDFIDIVGPLGTVIVENKLKGLGYTRGHDMDGTTYTLLLQSLIEEVPEEQRADFQTKHSY